MHTNTYIGSRSFPWAHSRKAALLAAVSFLIALAALGNDWSAPALALANRESDRGTAAPVTNPSRRVSTEAGSNPEVQSPRSQFGKAGIPIVRAQTSQDNSQSVQDDVFEYLRRGHEYLERRHWHEARTAFEEVIDLDSSVAEAYIGLGHALGQLGEGAAAIAAYRRALELDHANLQTYWDLGLALLDQGSAEEAIATLERAVRLAPSNPAAYRFLAWALSASGEVGEAIRTMERCLEIDKKNPDHYVYLGALQSRNGDLAAARANFTRALNLDPNHRGAAIELSWLNESAQGIRRPREESLKHCKEVVRQDPRDPVAHSQLGDCLAEKGFWNGAISSYRRALDLDSNNAQAHFGLGMAFAAKEDWVEAVVHYKESLELGYEDTENPWLIPSYFGQALWNAGRQTEALDVYATAVSEKVPGYENLYLPLAGVLYDMHIFEEAWHYVQLAQKHGRIAEPAPKFVTDLRNLYR